TKIPARRRNVSLISWEGIGSGQHSETTSSCTLNSGYSYRCASSHNYTLPHSFAAGSVAASMVSWLYLLATPDESCNVSWGSERSEPGCLFPYPAKYLF